MSYLDDKSLNALRCTNKYYKLVARSYSNRINKQSKCSHCGGNTKSSILFDMRLCRVCKNELLISKAKAKVIDICSNV